MEPKQNDTSRASTTYYQAVQHTFRFLKQTRTLADLFAKSISLENDLGLLVPVCELHATDDNVIAKLAQWRAENQDAFPTQFPVTTAGTATWLRNQVLDCNGRFLFLVLDRYGNPVGHMGFAHALNELATMEADNIVRGVKNISPGIMAAALSAMINWAEEMFHPKKIFLLVFTENHHAIRFYKKIGFKEGSLIPLRRHQQGDRISYQPFASNDSAPPDKTFLEMTYAPERHVDNSETILTAGPSISGRETSYVLDAVRNGWNQNWSNYLKRFEEAFAQYVGTRFAIATSSCTGALHIALAALGIGPGDEVIVPDITWVATANAVRHVGATPVFADVDLQNWCLDPISFESVITERTKAVIPVHLYGHPAPMDKITNIARRHHLFVVEDAAPAIGAEFQGRKTGTFGEFAAFSFQGAKLLVTGEGGILLTSDEALYRKAYSIWDQGRVSGTFWIETNGLKYKMANVQAALGLAQLERVAELIEAKRQIFSWYVEGLKDIKNIRLNYEAPSVRSIYWMTSIYLSEEADISRDEFCKRLKERRIDTRPVFPAISQYPIWGKLSEPKPNAERIMNQALNLPSGVCLKRYQVQYVCDAIRKILA